MDKRNVLVSGGTRGVGLAIARKLAADGYCVFALGRKPTDALTKAIAAAPAGRDELCAVRSGRSGRDSRSGARK